MVNVYTLPVKFPTHPKNIEQTYIVKSLCLWVSTTLKSLNPNHFQVVLLTAIQSRGLQVWVLWETASVPVSPSRQEHPWQCSWHLSIPWVQMPKGTNSGMLLVGVASQMATFFHLKACTGYTFKAFFQDYWLLQLSRGDSSARFHGHQEGSVKERCGFKEATLTWHNCSAPAWLEHLGEQKTGMENQYFKTHTTAKNDISTRLFYYFLIQRLGPSPICWFILGWWKLIIFLQGCGIHGWPLWWCATTMLTFAGWATPRILRRWCQTVVAKGCVPQRSFVLDSLVDDICFVSQNDSFVPWLKTSMVTALKFFYKKHPMHFSRLDWECLYLSRSRWQIPKKLSSTCGVCSSTWSG